MCFSASASFGASAVLTLSGMLALKQVRAQAQIMFAGIPLFFALQQALEGCIWLNLQSYGNVVVLKYLALGYLFFAHFFWPLWIPLSLLPLEKVLWRKRALMGLLLVGALFVVRTLVLYRDFMPQLVDGHLVYGTYPISLFANATYLIATIMPFFVMERFLFKIAGVVVALALLASWLFFYSAVGSVWCFFAAVLSALLVIAVHYLNVNLIQIVRSE